MTTGLTAKVRWLLQNSIMFKIIVYARLFVKRKDRIFLFLHYIHIRPKPSKSAKSRWKQLLPPVTSLQHLLYALHDIFGAQSEQFE